MQSFLLRICLMSSLLMSDLMSLTALDVRVSNETDSTADPIIDPRIQLISEEKENIEEIREMCPINDISVYMTGCWIGSFNVWQLNVSEITVEGVVRATCQSSSKCDFKFCCAAYQSMKCFSNIGQHLCAEEFAQMSIGFDQMLSRVCRKSVPEDKCLLVLPIPDVTDTNVSESVSDSPNLKVFREPELQKITIQLRFNGSFGVIASSATVLMALLISALFI